MTYETRQIMEEGGGINYLSDRFDLTCTEVLMLGLLLRFDHPVDGCHPTQKRLMYESGRTQRAVQIGLKCLEEKRLIDREKSPYRDRYGRWCKGKIHHYIFSEEIDRALQIATETFEIKRKGEQGTLFGDAQIDDQTSPIRAQIDDQTSPIRAQGTLFGDAQIDDQTSPIRAQIDDQTSPIRAQIDDQTSPQKGLGGGGPQEDLLSIIRSFNPHHQRPNAREAELSLEILRHPAISMPANFSQAIAAQFVPRAILDRCAIYHVELRDGQVRGIGALIYRFAHRIPARSLTEAEKYTMFYEEMTSFLDAAYYAADSEMSAALDEAYRCDREPTR